MTYVINKCRNYARIGIAQIFVLDPESKMGWQWQHNNLKIISNMQLGNASFIDLDEVWRRLEAKA